MIQFFLLGASTVYGVGGENGGWGDFLKQHIHQKMYSANGVGEKYEVFNFAKSGATVRFVLDTFPEQIKNYGRGDKVVALVGVGGNNAKASGTPDNFVSTVDEYIAEMTRLINLLKQHSNHVIVTNSGYVDESKTNPKINPLNGSKSYFTNARRLEFRTALEQLCQELDVKFIDVSVSVMEWQEKYLYVDGLHPNNEGHKLLFEAVRETVEELL